MSRLWRARPRARELFLRASRWPRRFRSEAKTVSARRRCNGCEATTRLSNQHVRRVRSPATRVASFLARQSGRNLGNKSQTKKTPYEKPKNHIHHNNPQLPCVFTVRAGDQSDTGRVLSRVHDSGRVRRTKQPHYWRWKYRPWLEVALLE